MRVRCFTDTDTLWIEPQCSPTVETRDVDQDTLVEVDAARGACAITTQ